MCLSTKNRTRNILRCYSSRWKDNVPRSLTSGSDPSPVTWYIPEILSSMEIHRKEFRLLEDCTRVGLSDRRRNRIYL